MPRNASGQYDLPTGINPVVPFTTITASWANPTLQDLAAALTDSLSRTGLGGMNAPFRLADGTVAAPGLAFANETGLGLYRIAIGTLGFAAGGYEIARYSGQTWNFKTQTMATTFMGIKANGVISYVIHNSTNGSMYICPSTNIDGENWDFGKGMTLRGSDGALTALSNFTFNAPVAFQSSAQCNSSLVVAGGFQGQAPSSFLSTLGLNGLLTANGGINTYGINTTSIACSGQVTAKGHNPTTYSDPSGLAGARTIDYNLGQVWTTGIANTGSATFINIPNGGFMRLFVSNFYGGFITWNNIIWAENTGPIQGGANLVGIITIANMGTIAAPYLLGTLIRF